MEKFAGTVAEKGSLGRGSGGSRKRGMPRLGLGVCAADQGRVATYTAAMVTYPLETRAERQVDKPTHSGK